MLVLSRKAGEKIIVDNNIVVTVLSTEGGRVRIGVAAPEDVRILRGELVFEPVAADVTIQVASSK